jgi:hypothetical protein
MYNDNFNNIVYEILSQVTGLKFKPQIKNSGIFLEDIFKMKNLTNDKTHFVLYLDKKLIEFKDKREFIVKFHNHLIDSVIKLKSEFKDLQKNENDYMFMGENYIYHRHEEIGSYTDKQMKLINRMKEFHSKLEVVNK